MIYISDFGGEPPDGPPFWSAIVRTQLNTSTGDQDITVPGLPWTPKAARFTVISNTLDASPNTTSFGGVGATDGTNGWYTGWTNVSPDITTGRTSASVPLWMIAPSVGTTGIDAKATIVGMIPGGMRININDAPGTADFIVVEFFGGSAMSAKVGVFTGATSGNVITVTPSFQANALFFASAGGLLFNGSTSNTAVCTMGFATYDGSTLLQCQFYSNFETVGSRGSFGAIGASNILNQAGASTTGLSIENVTSTTFDIRSNGFNASTRQQGYLALNFGGHAQAWCGVVDLPTSTGNADLGSAGFTPSFVSMMSTRYTAINTQQTSGEAFAFALSSIDANEEFCCHWRSTDAAGSGGTVDDFSEADSKAINTSDHRSQNDIDAAFDSFQPGAVRLNFTSAFGTATKAALMLIG